MSVSSYRNTYFIDYQPYILLIIACGSAKAAAAAEQALKRPIRGFGTKEIYYVVVPTRTILDLYCTIHSCLP